MKDADVVYYTAGSATMPKRQLARLMAPGSTGGRLPERASGARCAAGLVDTDLAKDLVTRVQGIVGKETAATFTVRISDLHLTATTQLLPHLLAALELSDSPAESRQA